MENLKQTNEQTKIVHDSTQLVTCYNRFTNSSHTSEFQQSYYNSNLEVAEAT